LLLFNLKLNHLIFSTSLNSSLIIFIRTYTVNYRNASDRLCVPMNIILLISLFVFIVMSYYISTSCCVELGINNKKLSAQHWLLTIKVMLATKSTAQIAQLKQVKLQEFGDGTKVLLVSSLAFILVTMYKP